MALDHFRRLDDGLEFAAGGPSIPALEELPRGALIAVSPQFAEEFLKETLNKSDWVSESSEKGRKKRRLTDSQSNPSELFRPISRL